MVNKESFRISPEWAIQLAFEKWGHKLDVMCETFYCGPHTKILKMEESGEEIILEEVVDYINGETTNLGLSPESNILVIGISNKW